MFRSIRVSSIAILAACGLLGCLTAAGQLATVHAQDALSQTALPSAEPGITIYDPDPAHLWNRLHMALWVRTGPDGIEYGHDRLDPLLWPETTYLLEGESHERAIAALDEFLTVRGQDLVTDPLKRAILQRDLWALFDWTAEPGENTREAHSRRPPPPRLALLQRLARCIQRLALTDEQIEKLPDNYAAAVASKAFAPNHDPDHPDRPFLPPDLFQRDGPWVETQIDNGSAVIATRHVFDFGARSAFRVFLRLPEGREATIAYFERLRDFPQPWSLTRAPDQKQESLELSQDLPQFPVGTQIALVRQMLVIDRQGRIATTSVTESVQIRVFRAITELTAESEGLRTAASDQDFHEFTRGRADLFAPKQGGLRPLGPTDVDFSTQLLVMPGDEFEAADNVPFERVLTQPLQNCLGCHDRPGIFSIRSYTGGTYPRGRYDLPILSENSDSDTQAQLSAIRKREQYSWGLLQGLWDD